MILPDVENHVLERLALRLPLQFTATGNGRNIWPGEERLPDGVTLHEAHTVRLVGARDDQYNDGLIRWFEVQLLSRHLPDDFTTASRRARQVFEALQQTSWVAGDGTRYIDCQYNGVPRLVTNAYFTHNFSLCVDVGETTLDSRDFDGK